PEDTPAAFERSAPTPRHEMERRARLLTRCRPRTAGGRGARRSGRLERGGGWVCNRSELDHGSIGRQANPIEAERWRFRRNRLGSSRRGHTTRDEGDRKVAALEPPGLAQPPDRARHVQTELGPLTHLGALRAVRLEREHRKVAGVV